MTVVGPGTAMVVGASSGIGLAAAKMLESSGWKVITADRELIPVGEGESFGEGWRHEVVDVTDVEAVGTMIEGLASRGEKVQALAYCVGTAEIAPFLETEVDAYRRAFEVNVLGAVNVCRPVAMAMGECSGGSIVLVSSIAGIRASRGRAAYGASKAALTLLGKTMALDLAELGVRVNVVAPGATWTPLVQRVHDEQTRSEFRASVPLGRYAEPAEVAAAICFLLGPESSYISGEVIAVDGGLAASH